jgi:metal transporter CNNM
VKQVVKRGLTQRLRQRVGMGDSDSSDEDEKEKEKENKQSAARRKKKERDIEEGIEEGSEGDTLGGENGNGNGNNHVWERDFVAERGRGGGVAGRKTGRDKEERSDSLPKSRRTSFQLPKAAAGMTSMSMLEQSMPADAVLGKEGVEEVILFCANRYSTDVFASFCKVSIRR